MLEALGAEVILLPQIAGEPEQVSGPDIAAAARIAEQVASERGGFYVDQFNAPEAKAAHESGTARELLDAVTLERILVAAQTFAAAVKPTCRPSLVASHCFQIADCLARKYLASGRFDGAAHDARISHS